MALADLIGWVAAGLVLATFCAKRMASLRALAIVSNIAFVVYGYAAGLWPILVLHSIMLPLNVLRLREALGVPEALTTGEPFQAIEPIAGTAGNQQAAGPHPPGATVTAEF
jgi:hypothetical protein